VPLAQTPTGLMAQTTTEPLAQTEEVADPFAGQGAGRRAWQKMKEPKT